MTVKVRQESNQVASGCYHDGKMYSTCEANLGEVVRIIWENMAMEREI